MILNSSVNFAGQIYFYCDPRKDVAEGEKFQHLLICLAEGFLELGIPFYSNVNYWQQPDEKAEYLFRHHPEITPHDCSIVVFSNTWYHLKQPLPEDLFNSQRRYITVYLDGEDDDKTYSLKPEFKQFDFILRNHYNRKLNYAQNFHPWAFGLTNRILRELKDVPSFTDKNQQLLVNFRHWKSGHPVRNISCSQFIPQMSNILPIDNYIDSSNNRPADGYHYLQWLRTGERHYPTYYKRLKSSAACACFGGFFVPAWPKNPGDLINRIGKRLLTRLKLKSNTIVQWDSWRFWESLAAGCATFHLDFEKYGIALPVMPKNWQHYIGIDLDNVQATVDRIADDPGILESVATAGRLWALEHYTPVPTALRFLETIYQKQRVDDIKLEQNPNFLATKN
ncbi:MAG: glycosyltransferase family 1 protein [Desmonostoc vinosum HA7617-LM4]|jgi:hypothetical protein|nr:glycosyltransferase family 1 protein [Desmonostoc vinosum HA7617-LM4]